MTQTAASKNMQKKNEQGFVLLYAMIIMVAVLSASATILTIYIKELKLSGIGRESVIAYYAAESGAECALYWFLRGADFSADGAITALHDHDGSTTTPPQVILTDCNGQQIQVNGGVYRYQYDWVDVTKPCADVEVVHGNPSYIRSRGYNTCDTTQLQIERGYEITY